jgi:hypothetical protein
VNREGQVWMKTLNRAPASSNPYRITMFVIDTRSQVYPRPGSYSDLVDHVHTCVLTHSDGRLVVDTRTECRESEPWEKLSTYERVV